MIPAVDGIAHLPVAVPVAGRPNPAAPARDIVQIASPFLANVKTEAGAPPPIALPVAAAAEEPAGSHLTVFQKAAMAGLGGLAVMGTVLTAGTGVALAAEPPAVSQTMTRDTTLRQEQARPGQHIKVFGQDVGTVGDEVPGVKWDTYKGTQSGVGYSIEYPTGWKVTNIFNGLAVINPKEPTTMVVFEWRSGQGYMNPQALINTLLQEARAGNVQVHTTKPSGPNMTPVGPLYVEEEDVSYTADGQHLRAGFTSAVAQAPSSYVPFWTGNLVAGQSSEHDFQKYVPIMRHIGNSFTQN